MKKNNYSIEEKYILAKKKVKRIKGFYTHLLIFIFVNIFIISVKVSINMSNGNTFEQSFFSLEALVGTFFWSIGLLCHFLGVFGDNVLFTNKWQERKIQEYLVKKEKQNLR